MARRSFGTVISGALISAALFAALPAFAQFAPAGALKAEEADPDAIVVTGKTEAPPAEVRKQAQSITQSGPRYNSVLAQFQDKVCPGVIGLPLELAEIMVGRIRRNAEVVGLGTAPDGKCQPNIIVAFVANGQQLIKEIAKREPTTFRNIDHADLTAMIRDDGPVHAWVSTVVRSRQGDELQGDNKGDLTKIPVLNVAQSQSHIFLAARLDITNSVILIVYPKIDGMSVVQLADYATMRAFARTRPVAGDAAASTILSMFDGDAAKPRELTDFDLAYLRSIYGGIPNLNAASKLARINRELRQLQASPVSAEGD